MSEVLTYFNRAGENTITFNFITADYVENGNSSGASGPSLDYGSPEITISYDERGIFYEPDLETGWDETMPEGFGLVEVGETENALDGVEAGVYPFTAAYVEPSPEETAGSSSSVAETEPSEPYWEVELGAKTGLVDPYDTVDTPELITENAADIASKFSRGISSEIETTHDLDTMELIASALGVDGIVKDRFPEFTYSQVDIFYGRTARTFTYSFYGYVDDEHQDEATLGNGFMVAEARLFPSEVEIDAFDDLFGAAEETLSSSLEAA